jgi:nicotinamidase-related amidase
LTIPAKNKDLHGAAPDRSSQVLVLLDLINDFEFPGAQRLFRQALAIAPRIAALKARARRAGVPVIYVNDNFGRWQSDFRRLLEHCLNEDVRGRPIAQMLKPEEDDYFVLKPKHSAFYGTALDLLLDYLQANVIILTGIAANSCVLFTANDAYMRDLQLFVPRDCVASASAGDTRYALLHLSKVLKTDLGPASRLRFSKRRKPVPGSDSSER